MARSKRAVQKDISRFLSFQRAKPRAGKHTLEDMISENRPIDKKELDRSFATIAAKVDDSKVSPYSVEYARKFCYDILAAVNDLTPVKRFYVLQTIDFLRAETGIANLVQLLLLGDQQVRRGLAVVFFSTFRATCEVIQTIMRRDDVFTPANRDSEKGELYVFQSDLARRLMKLLDGDFIEAEANRHGIDNTLPVDLLKKILEKRNPADLIPSLIEDEANVINLLVDYLALLQTHHGLYLYARKRGEYLKLFLCHDLPGHEIPGLTTLDISRVVAGFLAANIQLKPQDELIYDLITEVRYRLPDTLAREKAFLDQLAPQTLGYPDSAGARRPEAAGGQ
ncbi:MAG: hypothetical protein IID61_17765 [SAR324 cluster bacterium]|nr:hypothetical protein [SAR324 cluster bacterium]